MYNLAGVGVDNPYRVRPTLGHKLPVDKNYHKAFLIYNPHEEVLKLKEIYTSESFLLLSLPDVPQVSPQISDGCLHPGAARCCSCSGVMYILLCVATCCHASPIPAILPFRTPAREDR